ncbi:MAG: hypothetical protein KBT70_06345 [Roseovarius sp.]|nr:hypothetical protein [Roseovarius sp.]MBQ0749804.1 hypothetical protein [Roseovarius sp.]MBQ0809691.1 hypothetical protein [Roseovarius sp.]
MLIRKTVLIRDRTETDEMGTPRAPLTRVARWPSCAIPLQGATRPT